jgi:hypothetical protein
MVRITICQIKNPAEVRFKSTENELLLLHNDRDFDAMAAVWRP